MWMGSAIGEALAVPSMIEAASVMPSSGLICTASGRGFAYDGPSG